MLEKYGVSQVVVNKFYTFRYTSGYHHISPCTLSFLMRNNHIWMWRMSNASVMSSSRRERRTWKQFGWTATYFNEVLFASSILAAWVAAGAKLLDNGINNIIHLKDEETIGGRTNTRRNVDSPAWGPMREQYRGAFRSKTDADIGKTSFTHGLMENRLMDDIVEPVHSGQNWPITKGPPAALRTRGKSRLDARILIPMASTRKLGRITSVGDFPKTLVWF